MKLDFDTYKEILDTLTRNKSRSFLTGFGVFWGVFMLVALIGGGKGLKQLLAKNFEGFATNSVVVFAQNTTKPYAGFRKGRSWDLTTDDMTRLRENVPGLDVITPALMDWGKSVVRGENKSVFVCSGVLPDEAKIQEPSIRYGRYLNEVDMLQRRKVCVIGKKIYKELFPKGGDPTGEFIRVDSVFYRVVGVDYGESNINIGGRADQKVTIPMTLMQQTYNYGNTVAVISCTVRPGYTVSEVTNQIRSVIARAHKLDPTDEKAISVFNTEAVFSMLDNLFTGVNFLIWLVGIGTLLAGAIGVSNIMMVTVRERTVEIGIRRAIGATPRNILSQILSESLILTAVAGMSGILFAVLILQMLEMGSAEDGTITTHYQVGFWTAIGAAVMLSTLGMLAGLPPALRAMSIKPVEAMRDE
jgi:putative ABC transport system permease protein